MDKINKDEMAEKYSEDEPLNRVLKNVVNDVKEYAETQIAQIKRLSELGIALSAQRSMNSLLEKIIDDARNFSNADAGTLYILDQNRECLEFTIVQNDTLKTRMGGTAGQITWPSVPLKTNGTPNYSNVSSYVAITGETVNIPDVYNVEGFDFTGTRKFDAGTGYRSQSMLVTPMIDKNNNIIGVIQLINALDPSTKKPVSFSPASVEIITSLASLAVVALTNMQLLKESTENMHTVYTDNSALDNTIVNVVNNVKEYAEAQITHIKKLTEIGIALSSEKNLTLLLEKILDEARDFSTADAGTLYLLNEDNECLEFAIVQNDTMKTRMGGTAGPITWPPVPLKKEGNPNFSNVSTYAAITGEIVNIPDVYEAEGFDFTGTRKFDSGTGYRSHSMLVIPMKNKENETIGVLQLINALEPVTHKSVPFLPANVDLIASLASQAAVAVTNVRLYHDLEELFDSFIKTIAMAIDEKSPYTAGHIQRVQKLSMAIATKMNQQTEGIFKDFCLNADEMKEMSIAAWLHDIGKIITPEHVVDKSTKLERIFDRVHLIDMRYEVLMRDVKIKMFEEKLKAGEGSYSETGGDEQYKKYEEEYNTLAEEKKFVMGCNQPGEFMDDAKIERLKKISEKRWVSGEQELPYLSEDELYNLSIRKGTLTNEERKVIENHVLVTFKMLGELPFPKKLRRVTEYASGHHEKLDGTGYPFGLKADKISYPARIIAIADIFEALTAKDRPYKKPMPLSNALKILSFMKKDGHIDGDILELFINEKIYLDYAKQELDPGQIDC